MKADIILLTLRQTLSILTVLPYKGVGRRLAAKECKAGTKGRRTQGSAAQRTEQAQKGNEKMLVLLGQTFCRLFCEVTSLMPRVLLSASARVTFCSNFPESVACEFVHAQAAW